jgi:hypothetical protein
VKRAATPVGTSKLKASTEEQIGYHVYLMGQAGLLEVSDTSSMDSRTPEAIPLNMTWYGHEFLDATKDSDLWAKAKKNVIGPAGGVAFSVLLEWLKEEAKNRLGLPR